MDGDARRTEQVRLSIRYELSEDVSPTPGMADPVLGPAEYSKVKKQQINRVFYFLAFSTVVCLGAVAAVPNPVVQETALGVWVGAAGLARFLLAGVYRKGRKDD
jgi:hypothetical protein